MVLPSNTDIKAALTRVLDATGRTIERFAPLYHLSGSTVRAWYRDATGLRSMSYIRQCELIRALEAEGVRFIPSGGFVLSPVANDKGAQTLKPEPLVSTTPLINGHNSVDRSMETNRMTMPS
jgi:hypothetical protein